MEMLVHLIGREIEDLGELHIFICDKGSIKVKDIFPENRTIKY